MLALMLVKRAERIIRSRPKKHADDGESMSSEDFMNIPGVRQNYKRV